MRDAHGDTMLDKCLADVKRIFGLQPEDALADQGFAKYGVHGASRVLDIAVSVATLQLTKPRRIYATIGLYRDGRLCGSKDDCHCMTPHSPAGS